MKRLISKKIIHRIFICLFLLNITTIATATTNTPTKKKTEFTQTIEKHFPIDKDGTVEIQNKYGKVEVKSWMKDEVKIEITIRVKSSSEDKAKKTFDRIHFDFENQSDFVGVATEIARNNGRNNSTEFAIDYEVYMPRSCHLNLDNKYGDAFITELDGEANITVKYGDVRMDGINNNTKLKIGYGNGTLIKCKNLTADIQYGSIRSKAANNVNLESQYSKVHIDKAAIIKSVSRYDDYFLGNINEFKNEGRYDDIEIEFVNKINCETQFSDIIIEHLSQQGDFEMQYGSIEILNLENNFSELNLEVDFTDIKITMDATANYHVNVDGDYASIRYPDDLEVYYEKDSGLSHQLKGFRGSKEGGGQIKAALSYGSFRLK